MDVSIQKLNGKEVLSSKVGIDDFYSIGKLPKDGVYKCVVSSNGEVSDVAYAVTGTDFKIKKTNKSVKKHSIKLQWKKVKDVNYYNIYASDYVGRGYVCIGTTEKTSFKYSNKNKNLKNAYFSIQPVYENNDETVSFAGDTLRVYTYNSK